MNKNYLSPLTQEIANKFASWQDVRNNTAGGGWRFLNTFGVHFKDYTRSQNSAIQSLFLSTVDLSQMDVIYKATLPYQTILDTSNLPIVTTEYGTLSTTDTDADFLYLSNPTRIQFQSIITINDLTTETFNGSLEYDLPYINADKDSLAMYYGFDSNNNLIKYYWIPPSNLEKQVLGTYQLRDTNGIVLNTTPDTWALHEDLLVLTYGSNLYFFDINIPLDAYITNQAQEQTYCKAFLQQTLETPIIGLSFDEQKKYLIAISANNTYYKYRICHDICMFDTTRKVLLTREKYNDLQIGNIPYSLAEMNIWNNLDDFGVFLDQSRDIGEENKDYKTRLLDVFKFRSNSTAQGVVNGVTREFDNLRYYGYWSPGSYPTSLYPDGNYITGYNIYESGIYPDNTYDIAKINALQDPFYYSTLVTSGIPNSAEIAGYTKEILQTFPIIWGSGTDDIYAFIWDLAHFDSGTNKAKYVPNFFSVIASGIEPVYFQSGVNNPSTNELMVSFNLDNATNWQARVNTGDFYIHETPYHVYSDPGYDLIPSGTTTYLLPSSFQPGQLILITESGYGEWANVIESGIIPTGREYIVSGDTISLNYNHPNTNLDIMWENGTDAYTTLPWDFNPLHALGYNGFVWVTDKEQIVDPNTGLTVTVNPSDIAYGSQESLITANLIDINGDYITGAIITFSGTNNIGELSTTEAYTQFDGDALSTYFSPSDTTGIVATGSNFSAAYTWSSYNTLPFTRSTESIWSFGNKIFTSHYANNVVQVYSSTDGQNWTLEGTFGFGSSQDTTLGNYQLATGQWDVTLFNGQLWLIGPPGGSRTFIYNSNDGVHWTQHTIQGTTISNPSETQPPARLVVLGSWMYFFGGPQGNNVYQTQDGINWIHPINETLPMGTSRTGMGTISYNGYTYIICGNNSTSLVPYTDVPVISESPYNDIWRTTNFINWEQVSSNVPFTSRILLQLQEFNGRVYIFGGANGVANRIYNAEVWSTTDFINWDKELSLPNIPTRPVSSAVVNGSIIALTDNTNNIKRMSQSGMKIWFDKVITSTSYDEMFTFSQVASNLPAPYPSTTDTIILKNDGPQSFDILSTDWMACDTYLGKYNYRYTIGGSKPDSSDEYANIDTTSLKYSFSSPILSVKSSSWIGYDVDNLTTPLDYGRVVIYSTKSDTITGCQYNSYSPITPFNTIVETSGTWVLYADDLISSIPNAYLVYPTQETIVVNAEYNGINIGPQYATINIGLDAEQQGVLRLDQKFAHYYSYLRLS